MKRALFPAALAAFLLAIPVSAASTLDREIPLKHATSVRLNVGGNVHVMVASAGSSIGIHLVDYGPSTPPIRFDTSRTGHRLDISITGPKASIVPIGQSGYSIDVTVPRDVKLDLRSSAGNVHIDRVTAPAQLYSANGSIVVDAADAPLTANADFGDVTVAAAHTMLELSCGQGNVSATLDLGWQGNLVRLEASQGNLTLSVPPDFRARYDLTAAAGSVHNALPSVPHAPLVFMLSQKGDVTVKMRQKS
jgi:hypothetical protein